MKFWPFRRRPIPVNEALRPNFGAQLCRALGLDPDKIRTLTLRVGVGRAATVDVTVYVDKVQGADVAEVVRRYRLGHGTLDPVE